jgi:thioredoxin reductase
MAGGSRPPKSEWDVVIVGGGPAGLSAALTLGRCCRSVLLCDAGEPRNLAARKMHGFLTREGIAPARFRRKARRELAAFERVKCLDGTVDDVSRDRKGRFRVAIEGRTVRCRKVLLATGVADELPPIRGIEGLWGRSVHSCPYCDGFELRGAPVAVYGKRRRGLEMARALTAWTRDVALCTDGAAGLEASERRALARNDISLFEDRIERLVGRGGRLEAVVFRGGRRLLRRALFFDLPTHPQSKLARRLGCDLDRKGTIRCGGYEATSVPGVFVAGNVAGDVQLTIVAAAEGTRAAFGINRTLTREDFERRAKGAKRLARARA